ncbi:MAG: DUF2460 domain-containing protein [Candidatus Sulfotelmatobacter sp.]
MPTLPLSMAKGLKKNPNFNTVFQKVAAGRGNASVSLKPYPTWDFEFDMDRITGNEALAASTVASFLGTQMACQGRNNLFLFTDPQDNTVSYATSGMLNVTAGAAAPMGTAGDGSSTQFQLARSIGGVAWDVIQNLNGSITVKVNGTVTTPSSISSTGVATFSSAPASGATLQWAGNFFFLCRFSADTVDATRSYTINSGTDQWDFLSIKFSSEFV